MQETQIQQAELAHELTSALADGELQSAEFTQALALLQASPEAQARWHAYQLLGDVLRSGAQAAVAPHDAAFTARLRRRLQQENSPALPAARLGRVEVQRSANDGTWRWKLLAGLSSLAMVAVVGWQLTAPAPQAVQLAISAPSQAAQAPVGTEPLVMIRDPRLDQLISAHQQLGGTSALQMPAGFLRNATFERPTR